MYRIDFGFSFLPRVCFAPKTGGGAKLDIKNPAGEGFNQGVSDTAKSLFGYKDGDDYAREMLDRKYPNVPYEQTIWPTVIKWLKDYQPNFVAPGNLTPPPGPFSNTYVPSSFTDPGYLGDSALNYNHICNAQIHFQDANVFPMC
jgi:hypothetical protein